MGVNTMDFQQAAIVLADLAQQATGQKVLTPTNTQDFISVGQTTMRGGLDPVYNAISQVMARSFMGIRPYTAKLRGMEFTEAEWGAVTRKLTVADQDPVDDDAWKWPVAYDSGQNPPDGDGQSVDQWTIKKAELLQQNFYGFLVWSDHLSVFRDQLKVAFRGPDEFASFWGMVMTAYDSKHEQYYETFRRMCLANFIASIIDEADTSRNVHLLSEYNALSGQSLTATSVYQAANFKPFMQFVYSRIAELSSLMTERSEMFQTIISGKHVMHNTPYQDQRIYLLAQGQYRAEMMAIADTYHDNYLRLADHETLNFWQSIKTPDTVSISPVYIDSTGAVKNGSAVAQSNVFGVLADRNAFGVAEMDRESYATPLNARGKYSNLWWHSKLRAFNDLGEKGVVLLLD